MSGIFISYRRQDSEWVSGLIYDRLAAHFGPEAIFTDIDSIPLGENFKTYIDEQVGKCDIFLAIIGEQWLNVTDDDNRLRLEQSEDFVRLEIESALKRKIPVIPILVGDTEMPPQDRLPKSLSELALRNGTMIRPKPTLDSDVERLIRGIEKQLSMQNNAGSGLPKWMAKNWTILTPIIGLTVAVILTLRFWPTPEPEVSKPSAPGVYLQLDVNKGSPLRLDHLLQVADSEIDLESFVGWCLKNDGKKYTPLDYDDVDFCSQ